MKDMHESCFRLLFERAPDAIFLANVDTGIIEDANEAATRLLIRPRQEIVGMHFTMLHPQDMIEGTMAHFHSHIQQSEKTRELHPIEHFALRSDGTMVPIEVMATILTFNNSKILLGIFRDISLRRQMEAELRDSREQLLTKEIEAKAEELKRSSATLSMMLDYARKAEQEIKERVVANLHHNIFPLIDQLKRHTLPPEVKSIINGLEQNTHDLTHPLANRLNSPLFGLTTREIQVAHLIRQGKSSKDIMEMLCLSFQTVQSHRSNLRRKLGIQHKKINLFTYLNSHLLE